MNADQPTNERHARGQEMVEDFLRRFPERTDYRALACHAALPLALTPELLKFLRHEFLPHVSWVAEVDLLLSKFCDEAAEGVYVMKRDARAYLIRQMREDKTLGEIRIEAVNRMLIERLDYLARNHPAILPHEWQTQRLSAMLYVAEQRDEAARALAEAIYQCLTGGVGEAGKAGAIARQTELARLTRLVREEAANLQDDYPDLVRLAQLIGQILADRSHRTVEDLRASGQLSQTFKLPSVAVELPLLEFVARTLKPDPRGRFYDDRKPSDDDEVRQAEQRLERELAEAREMQMRLTPAAPPVIPGYDLEGVIFSPRQFAGDYYDFIERSDGSVVIASGDVSGKGTLAARLMSLLHTAVRAKTTTGLPANEVICQVNTHFLDSRSSNGFATLFYSELDARSHKLTYVNAGHTFPLLIRASGDVTLLSTSGIPLGIFPSFDYREEWAKLELGDALVIYSDGVTECLSEQGEEFGEERLIEVVLENRSETAASLCAHINKALSDFAGPAEMMDDRTLVVLKRKSAEDAGKPVEISHPTSDFEFETVTLDTRGTVKERRKLQARQFFEELAPNVALAMVEIPGGKFTMGSPEVEAERLDREGPQYKAPVPPFYIGKFAITQAEWHVIAGWEKVERELKSVPSSFTGAARPVENVNWEDAKEFCARLAKKTGRLYRLPSEAEWEYACRAGTTTPFAFGETITPEIVNYDGNYPYAKANRGRYRGETIPVGSLGVANAFGLFDMHGNVWEWCEDVWHDNYYGAPTDGSVWLSGGDPSRRILRGGSYFNDARICRSGYRSNSGARYINDVVGLRVVVSARTS